MKCYPEPGAPVSQAEGTEVPRPYHCTPGYRLGSRSARYWDEL